MGEFGFEDKEIPMNVLFNEEQLLDFALHYLAIHDDEPHQVAEQIVVTYILREYQKQDKTFTEEEVLHRMAELVGAYVLVGLVKKGLVEVEFNENGDPIYKHTDLEGLM